MGSDGDLAKQAFRVRKSRAEKAAAKVLEAAGVTRPPIPVEALAKRAGAKVRYRSFDGDISGLLVRSDDGEKIVAVHSGQPKVRQRFTIAHELGHLTLHKGDTVIVEHLTRRAHVSWRDGASSGATDLEEIEANQFAAALLMPAEMVESDYWAIARRNVSDDTLVALLSRRYHVSNQAMRFRLLNLALVDPT